MVAKTNQQIKRERNRIKREKIDKTTNRYMIHLAWGILVILLLRVVESGYSGSMVLAMPVIMKSLAVGFLLIGAALFVCGKMNVLGKASTFIGYGIFAAVLAVGSLWLGFFPQIRNFFGSISPSLLNLDSRWWVSRGPITLVAIYLVAALIWTAIRIALLEKGKK